MGTVKMGKRMQGGNHRASATGIPPQKSFKAAVSKEAKKEAKKEAQPKPKGEEEKWVLARDKSYVVSNAELTAHIPTHLAAGKGEVRERESDERMQERMK